jgi:formate hydrogenlyase subunit 3/multisubunit Na+/H+ antiporter MnhD subunit
MTAIIAAILLLLASGLAALFAGRSRWSGRIAASGAVLSAVVGLPAAASSLFAQASFLRLPWSMPFGTLLLRLDALSGLFLLPILALPALAAVYGERYMAEHSHGRPLGAHWFFYNTLAAGMALVALAANGLLFLLAWEVMSLASFFLVIHENDRDDVREAGWIYLVATHFGAAFLVTLFVLLAAASGSFDFDASPVAAPAHLLFILALVGFGAKAGLVPLHVWLPAAHPVAPSHVSAVMSGVMIKMGVYGLLRVVMLLGGPRPEWGWTLLVLGVVSSLVGIAFALAQDNLKRILAYSSVENVGIICIGLGLGFLAASRDMPVVASLAVAGALFHVLSHSVMKGLLFLAAGSVASATHTLDLDRLGGLLKRMPVTGAAFFAGSVAISALPPMAGFAGEFLIYLAAFSAVISRPPAVAFAAAAAAGALALIGGLAAACFTRAFGIVWSGEPRSEHAAHAAEVPSSMRAVVVLLAALAVILGLAAPFAVLALSEPVSLVSGVVSAPSHVFDAARSLAWVTTGSAVLVAAACVVLMLRSRLLSKRQVAQTVTWDCGYARPTARMQYTGASFSQPLCDLFHALLLSRKRVEPPSGLFPQTARFETETPDAAEARVFRPVFSAVARALARLQTIQHGNVHLYVLSIVLTLIALLAWKLR